MCSSGPCDYFPNVLTEGWWLQAHSLCDNRVLFSAYFQGKIETCTSSFLVSIACPMKTSSDHTHTHARSWSIDVSTQIEAHRETWRSMLISEKGIFHSVASRRDADFVKVFRSPIDRWRYLQTHLRFDIECKNKSVEFARRLFDIEFCLTLLDRSIMIMTMIVLQLLPPWLSLTKTRNEERHRETKENTTSRYVLAFSRALSLSLCRFPFKWVNMTTNND